MVLLIWYNTRLTRKYGTLLIRFSGRGLVLMEAHLAVVEYAATAEADGLDAFAVRHRQNQR